MASPTAPAAKPTVSEREIVQPSPAAMPSEGEIAVLIGKLNHFAKHAGCSRALNEVCRQAVESLEAFAPILAENNRMREDIIGLDADVAFANIRILAAEAALAGEREKRKAIITLLYTDEVFVGSHWEEYPHADKGVWPAFCANVSSYGADAEEIPEEDLIPLAGLVERHGDGAIDAWACHRRGLDKPNKGNLTEGGKAALAELRAAAIRAEGE